MLSAADWPKINHAVSGASGYGDRKWAAAESDPWMRTGAPADLMAGGRIIGRGATLCWVSLTSEPSRRDTQGAASGFSGQDWGELDIELPFLVQRGH